MDQRSKTNRDSTRIDSRSCEKKRATEYRRGRGASAARFRPGGRVRESGDRFAAGLAQGGARRALGGFRRRFDRRRFDRRRRDGRLSPLGPRDLHRQLLHEVQIGVFGDQLSRAGEHGADFARVRRLLEDRPPNLESMRANSSVEVVSLRNSSSSSCA